MTVRQWVRAEPAQCDTCRGWFVAGMVSCCVQHSSGTCCHYGDRPVPAPAASEVGAE